MKVISRWVIVLAAAVGAARAGAEARAPAGWDNAVHIPDPLPHLEAMLTSKAVRWALMESPDAKKAFGSLFGPTLDLDDALRAVRRNAEHIPAEIVLAAPAESWRGVDHVIRLFLLIPFLEGLTELDRGAAAGARPRVQKALLAAVRGLRLPRAVVWARFRAEAQAGRLFTDAAGLARSLEASGWAVEITESALGLRARAGDFLDDEAAVLMLTELGALSGAGDPARRPLVAAFRALEGEAWLERDGAALRLTLGPRPPPAAEDPRRAGPETVLTARWDLRELKARAPGWLALLDSLESGELGAAARRKDVDDLLGTFRFLAEQVLGAGDRGTLRLFAESGTLTADLHTQGARRAEPLSAAPIMKLVPAGVEAVWCSSERGLGDTLKDLLLQGEDRLALRELAADLGGKDDRAAEIQRVSRTYYTHFALLREHVMKKLPAALPGPSAALLWSDARIPRLQVSFVDRGTPRVVSLTDLPFLDLAWITRVQPPAEARRLLDDLVRRLALGLALTFEEKLPASLVYLREADLGLGVETWELDGAWIKSVTGHSAVEFSSAGALRPHAFIVEGHLVISTSVRASWRVLATARAGGPSALALPPSDGEVIAYARVGRKTLVGMVDTLVGGLAAGARAAGSADKELDQAHAFLRSIASVLRDFRVVETQSGTSRRTLIALEVGTPD
jgi:hypothetical protein